MSLRNGLMALCVAWGVSGCGQTQPEPVAEQPTTGVSEAAATATRISATEGSLELSFETMGTFETRNGRRVMILRATANRYLQDVFSFVPDDIYGEANIISERRFEIALDVENELNAVLSGLPLFVGVSTFTGTPTSYTAKIEVFPRFFDFRGSEGMWVDEKVDPYFVRNGGDNVVYRGRVDGQLQSLAVTAADGVPTVSASGVDSYRLDWSYGTVHDAMDPHTVPLTFTASLAGGVTVQKTARLVPRVTSLALTTGDAYEVWPTPECQLPVYNCIHAQPQGTTDYAACGTFRQVQRCWYVNDVCAETPPQALSLEPRDAASLEPARAAWNVGSNGGVWYGLKPIQAYSTPRCPQSPPTLQGIFEKLQWSAEYRELPAFEDGTVTNRAGLGQSVFLSDSGYGDGGPLLAAIDAYAGGGEVQAWFATSEVPCHNCHEFNRFAVLYYPATRTVIVLQGYTGYDS
ncbi:hypothetical protein NVS55_24360 [Myxococcus stipitatus]|uniref:hypothetical protein n=1 Tax=Myxococcus stipitatus TaxID=83455 RepID=UPI0031452B74